jgi:outer membrane protein TolC
MPPANGPEATPAPAGQPLGLGECIAAALQNQPAIKAARHSRTEKYLGKQALANLPWYAERFSPDIPVRRMQSTRGVDVAAAAVRQAEQEAVYDVTRLYYSYVYAGQQEKAADDAIKGMQTYYSVAEEIVKSGIRDEKIKIDQFTLYKLQNRIGEVRLLKLQAETGRKQALEALKEAMGVDPCLDVVPRDTELPLMGGTVAKEQVVEWALANRPEMVQAAGGVDVFRLEVCAQSKTRGRFQDGTFAQGSDLHSKLIPLAERDGEYKPGGIAPEMPANLVGRKDERVARATHLSYKQDAVYDKTAGLIRLEAATAYLTWDAATRRMAEAKRRFDTARKQVDESQAAAVAQQNAELLVNNEAELGQAQAMYVQAVFEHLKALVNLERVTGGVVRPAFPGR